MGNKVFCRQDRRRWSQFCRELALVEQFATEFIGVYDLPDSHEEWADYQEPRVKNLFSRASSSIPSVEVSQ